MSAGRLTTHRATLRVEREGGRLFLVIGAREAAFVKAVLNGAPIEFEDLLAAERLGEELVWQARMARDETEV